MILKASDTPVSRYEVRFSGSGGQGLITAAVIFAEAAGVFGGRHVCQTQSYGPEARGGKSRAEVVISDQPIDYPKALNLDLLLAMNQAACDAYFFDLQPNGLLVVDSSLVEQYPTSRIIAIPFTKIAREEIGKVVVANMVALGAVGILSGQVAIEHLERSLLGRIPPGTEEMNLQALRRGVEEGEKVDVSTLPRALMSDDYDL
ncbi:MAG: 2-oxoacid:acceptor oxidoreductase family protein [Desulfobulbaceae bacterium]